MEEKCFTAAIIGCGNRGAESYGKLFAEHPDRYRITALCEPNGDRLRRYGELFGVAQENLFANEEIFWEKKRADFVVIATMDADHVRQCLRALELGYDILLEKPITDKAEECERLLAAQKKYGGKVLVCHVLRYAPAYVKITEMIEKGVIGRLVAMQAMEQVGYWHQAHSFVRGNWRSREETAPMILAKCCHDLDLLQFFAKSKCKSISSVGDLTYFKPENAPKGSAERCLDCACADDCPYNAKRIYTALWEEEGRPDMMWPHCQLTTEFPLNEAVIERALRNGPYGRCVFRCDNDVVDHQITQIAFENGVKASLTMTAFNAEIGRTIKFMGTLGEIVLNEEDDFVAVKPFGKPQERFGIKALIKGGYGHGGGDAGLVEKLYDVLSGKAENATSLEASVESHLMAICAERSRLEGGRLIYVHGE